MVSSRARKSRNLGTRLNDHEQRLTSAEAKARNPSIDADATNERLDSLEKTIADLSSPNMRVSQDAPHLLDAFPVLAADPEAPYPSATETRAGIAELATENEAILNPGPTDTIMTPMRTLESIDEFAPIVSRGPFSAGVNDWNLANSTGFYRSHGDALNAPPGEAWSRYTGVVYSDGYAEIGFGEVGPVIQEVWEYEAVGGNPGHTDPIRKWVRAAVPSNTDYTWSAWEALAGPPAVPDASETVKGKVELATAAETAAGTDNTRAVTPAGLAAAGGGAVPAASETVAGKVELATAAETIAGTDNTRAVTPAGLAASGAGAVPDATETVKGKVELATVAEATTGTDTTRAVTPAGLSSAIATYSIPDASETVKGKVELATPAETASGVDTTRAVTPAGLAAAMGSVTVPDATETMAGKVELATTTEASAGTDTTRAVTPAGVLASINANGAPAVPVASETVQGKVELATVAETTTGSDTTRAVTPAGVAAAVAAGGAGAVPVATTTVQGKVALATNAEAQAGADAAKAITSAALASRTATEARTGLVELATTVEATTGTDTTRAVTPAGVKAVGDTKASLSHTHAFSSLTSVPEAWSPIPAKTVTALPSAYPVGSTVMFINNDVSWPANYGTVRTDKSYASSSGGTIQYWSGYNSKPGEVWMRQCIYPSTGWTDWTRLDRVPFSTQAEAQLMTGSTDTMMTPQRVKDAIDTFAPAVGRAQTTVNVTDWNTATRTGFYSSRTDPETVSNNPPGSAFSRYTGFVTDDSFADIGFGEANPVNQIVWEYDATYGSSGSYTPTRTWWRGGIPDGPPGTFIWSTWKSSDASDTQRGMVEMATAAEAIAGVDTTRAVTPAGLAAAVPTATTTVSGKSLLATNAEAIAGTNTTKSVTPAALAAAVPAATTSTAGKVSLALWAEVQAGTDAVKAVTSAGLNSRTATEDRTGLVELATTTEALAGTDTARAVTPAGLNAVVNSGTWTNVTLTTNFSAVPGSPVQYRIRHGRIAVRGAVYRSSSTGSAYLTVFTLPAGTFPSGQVRVAGRADAGQSTAVTNDGQFQMQCTSGIVSGAGFPFDGISWDF